MVETDAGDAELCLMIQKIITSYLLMMFLIVEIVAQKNNRKRKRNAIATSSYSMLERIPHQIKHLHRMLNVSDNDCIVNLRMDRNTFQKLCVLLRDLGGLCDGKYVTIEEQVASFLGILAHHKKNRIVGFDYIRSGQTISHYLHVVLKAILKLHTILLVKPIPVAEDCDDPRWKWFKAPLTYSIQNAKKYLLRLIEENELAKAYLYQGEPQHSKLQLLFGLGEAIKEEASNRSVINISDTRAPEYVIISDTICPSPVRYRDPLHIPEDDEVTSPLASTHPISRPRVFDEESNTNNCRGSSFMPVRRMPRAPKLDHGESSCASSSPTKWYKPSK